jgi:hypothetical protein
MGGSVTREGYLCVSEEEHVKRKHRDEHERARAAEGDFEMGHGECSNKKTRRRGRVMI